MTRPRAYSSGFTLIGVLRLLTLGVIALYVVCVVCSVSVCSVVQPTTRSELSHSEIRDVPDVRARALARFSELTIVRKQLSVFRSAAPCNLLQHQANGDGAHRAQQRMGRMRHAAARGPTAAVRASTPVASRNAPPTVYQQGMACASKQATLGQGTTRAKPNRDPRWGATSQSAPTTQGPPSQSS